MRDVRSTSRFAVILLCSCGMICNWVFAQGQVSSPSPGPAVSTTTNAISRSVFRPLKPEDRDPFCPIGYKRPPPETGDGQGKLVQKPTEIKLKINAIVGKSALIESGSKGGLTELEEGQTYTYQEDKGSLDYKVVRITGESVVIEYDGREQEFKLKMLDIEKYLEKE